MKQEISYELWPWYPFNKVKSHLPTIYCGCRTLHQNIIRFMKYLPSLAPEHYMACEVSAEPCTRALYNLWSICRVLLQSIIWFVKYCRGLHKNIIWLVELCIKSIIWFVKYLQSFASKHYTVCEVSAELWTLFPYVPGT